MILVVEETTQWRSPNGVNHIYFLDKRKTLMYAYINAVTGEPKIFKKPQRFYAKDRTFETICQREIR